MVRGHTKNWEGGAHTAFIDKWRTRELSTGTLLSNNETTKRNSEGHNRSHENSHHRKNITRDSAKQSKQKDIISLARGKQGRPGNRRRGGSEESVRKEKSMGNPIAVHQGAMGKNEDKKSLVSKKGTKKGNFYLETN